MLAERFLKFSAASACLLAMSAVGPVSAQDYPNRPITWVVPFGPGGNSDVVSRIAARGLSEKLGQPVVVENKPGAGGQIGTEYVANAKPDGYTVLFASSGPMATAPYTRKALPYDPIKSFTPIYGMASAPLMLVVATSKPYATFQQLVDDAKARPGKINYASIGPGTAHHLTAELFGMGTKIDVVHIPYKTASQAIADVMSGTVDFMWELDAVVKPMIEAGKLRPLAASGRQRSSSFPDVLTASELGYPDVVFESWYTVVMPKGVPAEIADKFTAAFVEVMKEPAMTDFLKKTSSQPLPPMTRDELTAFFRSEGQKIKTIVEKAKIALE